MHSDTNADPIQTSYKDADAEESGSYDNGSDQRGEELNRKVLDEDWGHWETSDKSLENVNKRQGDPEAKVKQETEVLDEFHDAEQADYNEEIYDSSYDNTEEEEGEGGEEGDEEEEEEEEEVEEEEE